MQCCLMNLRAVMASAEGVIFCAVRKQRRQTLEFEGHLHAGAQFCGKRCGVCRLGIARLEGSAHGSKQMGVVGIDDILQRQVQRADEGLLSSGRKCSGPPRKATQPRMGLPQARPEMVWLTTA